jgi:hypothetical protein
LSSQIEILGLWWRKQVFVNRHLLDHVDVDVEVEVDYYGY